MMTSAGKLRGGKRTPQGKRKRTALVGAGVTLFLGATAWAAAFFVALPPSAEPSAFVPAKTPRPAAAPTLPAVDPREAQNGADLPNPQAPLLVLQERKQGIPFLLIEGGVAQTRRARRRCGVGQFVREAKAQAGLNGTFFADASLRGTDHILIGPTLCGNEAQPVFNPADNVAAVTGRPLVLLSPTRTRILPYNPQTMATLPAFDARLPHLTDAFLGGVWLVHNGVAADDTHLAAFHVKDAEDPRRRAFFCLLPDGRPALGATTYVAPSADLARALQSAGVREAVLLDSGFSTSLVYGKEVLVTGHTSPGIPSRPVPHALVLFGKTAFPFHSPVLMAKRA